jgi:peptidoglycan L-alanyl-D-glutamate endopeptidase CwlK
MERKLNGLSKKDRQKLIEADEKLQLLVFEVSSQMDIIVIETHRSVERQTELYAKGKTKVKHSKHNFKPSRAIDIAPYYKKNNKMVIPWEDHRPFYFLGGLMMRSAKLHNIKLRWGGDWDSDLDFADQTFNDLVHYELIGV